MDVQWNIWSLLEQKYFINGPIACKLCERGKKRHREILKINFKFFHLSILVFQFTTLVMQGMLGCFFVFLGNNSQNPFRQLKTCQCEF